ncbi:hypothetical protein [Oceanobacter antarcticus]|uniref:Uncharacterized protein n=1 Tax=Oceanobacter antarcticus TaxID=3133425 RepID=A0ABW8NFX5_9GAMM
MTDVSTAVMPPLNAFAVELANHIAGINEINAMNHPAPNGKEKYSVQTEFGTVFENRNWLGNKIIATQRKIMLIIVVATSRFTLYLPCMANSLLVRMRGFWASRFLGNHRNYLNNRK